MDDHFQITIQNICSFGYMFSKNPNIDKLMIEKAYASLTVSTPLGPVVLTQNTRALISVKSGTCLVQHATPLLQASAKWLEEFFNHPSIVGAFPYPIEIVATPYQRKTFHATRNIQAGEVRTYSQLANEVGGSPRSIGNALGANPLLFIIPCHRIIGKHTFGGYSGPCGIKGKEWLLRNEGYQTPRTF